MDKVTLALWPSAKHGAHVVWFSGGTETRRVFWGVVMVVCAMLLTSVLRVERKQ